MVSTPINQEAMRNNGGEGLMREMPVDNPPARGEPELEAEKTKERDDCVFSKASSKGNDVGGDTKAGGAWKNTGEFMKSNTSEFKEAHQPSSYQQRTNLEPKDQGGKKDGSTIEPKAKEKIHSIDIRKGKKSETSRLGNGRRSFHIFKQMARGKPKKEGQKIDIWSSIQTKATRKKKGGKEMMASSSFVSISNELGSKESKEGLKAFSEAIGINWKTQRKRKHLQHRLMSTNFVKVGLE
ncbi:hypothetical protein L6452_42479 [Arctium lappa]|uniref:Uncharacterized protein n=1 Tax=Arctium lappa TaxID=4217 RepID=A0ACB8XIL1_ARCLA|nr:hypothetical protein L6452_42479 [Arctium lappa]